MTVGFLILTVLFIIVSAIMVLIVLVQRPQGGGLAGAFGGAGGGSTDTVFGGRVGDALTVMTVAAFGAYLVLAILLNVMDPSPQPEVAATPAAATQPMTDAAQPFDSSAQSPDTTVVDQPGTEMNDEASDSGAAPPIDQDAPVELTPQTAPDGGQQ